MTQMSRVLVVEDDPVWQKFYRELLNALGISFVIVRDWSSLLTKLKRSRQGLEPFDGMILDLGLELDSILDLSRIEKVTNYTSAPILIATGTPDRHGTLSDECLKFDTVGPFIMKRLMFDRLDEVIKFLRCSIDQDLVLRASAEHSLRHLSRKEEEAAMEDKRKVFVVYGRDEKVRKGTFDFIRALGLEPVEWGVAIAISGDPAPYIQEVLRKSLSVSGAVLVLLTGDEEVLLKSALRSSAAKSSDGKKSLQARPNVFFELGLAFATAPGRVIVAEVGASRIPSDIDGIHRIRLSNSAESRNELAKRLELCGCPVKTGGSDWLTAGDISASS